MSNTKLSLAVSAILFAAACGGSDKPAAKAPEAESTPATAAADMAAPASTTATTDVAPTEKAPVEPAKVSLAVSAMKFTSAKKGKAPKALEIKADGSVSADGKMVAKIAGDHFEDASGKTLVTVGTDGAISGEGIKPGTKFAGDDIVMDDGAKLSVGDDGTVTSMTATAKKPETIGKFDNAGSAKRAAALVGLVWYMPKDAAPAMPATAAKAPAAKPEKVTKPATKK